MIRVATRSGRAGTLAEAPRRAAGFAERSGAATATRKVRDVAAMLGRRACVADMRARGAPVAGREADPKNFSGAKPAFAGHLAVRLIAARSARLAAPIAIVIGRFDRGIDHRPPRWKPPWKNRRRNRRTNAGGKATRVRSRNVPLSRAVEIQFRDSSFDPWKGRRRPRPRTEFGKGAGSVHSAHNARAPTLVPSQTRRSTRDGCEEQEQGQGQGGGACFPGAPSRPDARVEKRCPFLSQFLKKIARFSRTASPRRAPRTLAPDRARAESRARYAERDRRRGRLDANAPRARVRAATARG